MTVAVEMNMIGSTPQAFLQIPMPPVPPEGTEGFALHVEPHKYANKRFDDPRQPLCEMFRDTMQYLLAATDLYATCEGHDGEGWIELVTNYDPVKNKWTEWHPLG